jgi:stearoyl-CoA desaturase (delta-9 desaturase)
VQTFFLHRYASHGVFTLSRGWERFFHLLTWLMQGSSYLVPRAYAYMHRAHHAYSDTDKDPHTPHRFSNAASMMWATKHVYSDLVHHRTEPEPRFRGPVPTWPALERVGDHWTSRVGFGVFYSLFYIAFAPHWAFFLLLPIHYVMGPVHGAIVNWAGHKYGYRNFDTRDKSRNVLAWELLVGGELFQNNHHRNGQAANFAYRRFELDPTYWVIRLLALMGVLELSARSLRPTDEVPEEHPDPVGVPELEPAPAE